MQPKSVFISHASANDGFVAELRQVLESQGIPVWIDSRNLRGGDELATEVEQAIENARHVIVVLSLDTINSPWVRKEIHKAQEIKRLRTAAPRSLIVTVLGWFRRGNGNTASRNGHDYRVIPLLLPRSRLHTLLDKTRTRREWPDVECFRPK